MGITVYLIAALVFVGALAGAGYKGYRLGEDHERVANIAAQEEARKEEADRQAWNQLNARKEAKDLQDALTKQKGLNRELQSDLDKHLAEAAQNAPAGCPPAALTPSLQDDWNRANRAGNSASGRGLLGPSGPPAGTERAVLGGSDQKPR